MRSICLIAFHVAKFIIHMVAPVSNKNSTSRKFGSCFNLDVFAFMFNDTYQLEAASILFNEFAVSITPTSK